MNFTFEDITENPIMKKISENQLNQKYSMVTPSFGKKTPCVLTPRYIDIADKIKHFKVHSDDTWVISYPKSGTTWTQEMVWLICNNLDYKGAAESTLDKRFPFLEFFRLTGMVRDLPPEYDYVSILENMSSNRFIKSHLPQLFLPDELWTVKPKIVYIARKVKDVCVSFYYHHKMLQKYTGTLEEFAEAFLNDLMIYEPYHQHILDLYALRNESNILFLRYENMISDLEAEVRRTIKFFDKSFSDVEIQKLCNHLSFKSMKENKSINKSELTQILAPKNGEKDFIRKGQVNGWKDDLSEELSERFDNWTKSKIKNPRLLSLFI